MTPEILLTNDGTIAYEDGGAGGTATGAGALRFRDGKFAGTQAALIERAGTNLHRNPVPNSYIGWVSGGGTRLGSLGFVNDFGHDYGRSYGIADANSIFAPYGLGVQSEYAIDVAEGEPYTVSVHLHAAEARNVTFKPMLSEGSVATEAAGSLVASTWRRLAASFVAPATTTFDRGEWAMSAAVTVHGAELMVEQADHLSSFIPEMDVSGNLLPGYAWTGTAHNSASTRAATSITIPYAGTLGSLACWYSEDMGETWDFHYAESLGSIGDYGDISDDGSGNLVITSTRALLLGPLAVWSDTLTAPEQAGMQAIGSMWTWADVEQVTVTLDTAMTATGTSAATADTALTLGTAATTTGTSTATLDTSLLAYMDIAAGTAGTSMATASTALAMRTALASAGTSFAELRPEPPPVPLGTPLGTVGYTARPDLTVTSTLRPAPIAAGYTPRETPIAAGYLPRPPSED